MKSILYQSVCGLLISVLLFGCGQKNARFETSTSITEETPNPIVEVEVVKDSIDILIEQRAEQEFNSTIFGGLRFGSGKQTVEKVLKNEKRKGYSLTAIPIQVPVNDRVMEVVIRGYDAEYYNGQLASLELYSNETGLYNELASMFASKYGETKNNNWKYSNCEIAVELGHRVLYSSAADSWLASSQNMYYASFGGSSTKSLTTDPYYLVLSYKDYRLLGLIERQKKIKDSLEYVKRLQEEQKEKELARKLRTEVPTNI